MGQRYPDNERLAWRETVRMTLPGSERQTKRVTEAEQGGNRQGETNRDRERG